MTEYQKLLSLLKSIDDQLVGCMRCGMCQSVCPIYAETGMESSVARGKIALLEGLANKALTDPKGVQDRLNQCLLCGSCQAACPSGVKVLDIFLKARAFLTGYMGLSPAKQAIFRGMLSKPKVFNTVMAASAKVQGFFTKEVNELIGSSCATVMPSVLEGRHFFPLAKKPFHKMVKSLDEPKGRSGLRVAFFPGCAVDKIFPQVGEACLKVFAWHGVGVFMPAGQACCGIPALSSGDRKTFEELVKMNLALFAKADFDVLVTPCATCTSTIKKIWPVMVEHPSDKALVERLAAKAMDVNAFIAKNFAAEPKAGGEIAVTVHDPCHLKKSLGVTAEPRNLIGRNPNYRVVEMAGSDSCCGCGGSFTLQHYSLSKKIGEKKRDAVIATGAQIAAAGCPACMIQLGDMLSQAGAQVGVKHPIELYAEALA